MLWLSICHKNYPKKNAFWLITDSQVVLERSTGKQRYCNMAAGVVEVNVLLDIKLLRLQIPHSSVDKVSTCNARDVGSILGVWMIPWSWKWNLLQYSYLETPMDRGAWHGVTRVGYHLATKTPPLDTLKGFPGDSVIKNPPANARDAGDTGLTAGSGRCPWKRKRQSTPVFLLEKSYGQRSLVGYSLWGCKGSGTTEHTHTHTHTHTHRGTLKMCS